MKYPDFAKCYDSATRLLETIPEGQLCYGLYTPLSDKSKWDERWIREGAKSFLHYWVETGYGIVDTGSRQFGESSYKIASLNDRRYVKVGFVSGEEKIPVSEDITIKWETLIEEVTISIIWPQYDKYLQELGI